MNIREVFGLGFGSVKTLIYMGAIRKYLAVTYEGVARHALNKTTRQFTPPWSG
jgi:hypothetical protein